MKRAVSQFATPFCGAITARYNDPKRENPHQEGHWAWKRKSAKNWLHPERVWISTWQEQREHCAQEGLYNPTDIPVHAEISADGKKLKSQGLPGSWV